MTKNVVGIVLLPTVSSTFKTPLISDGLRPKSLRTMFVMMRSSELKVFKSELKVFKFKLKVFKFKLKVFKTQLKFSKKKSSHESFHILVYCFKSIVESFIFPSWKYFRFGLNNFQISIESHELKVFKSQVNFIKKNLQMKFFRFEFKFWNLSWKLKKSWVKSFKYSLWNISSPSRKF